jgi:hypothetical protein
VSIVSCCHGIINAMRQIGSGATRNGSISWHEETEPYVEYIPFLSLPIGPTSLSTSFCCTYEAIKSAINLIMHYLHEVNNNVSVVFISETKEFH